ncbi:RNA-binding protein 7 [Culicoides brevitarsis]|uniref:RNA-binding protein 7 n=1 Tax=Culicoides brevitarsis TaxID=469753 RepID=UPI00307C5506
MTSTEKSTKTEKPSDSNDEDDRTVFVGNITEKVTDELLYELFLQAGPVEEISIPKDRDTGKQKSFGFVRYKHTVSVPYACEIFKGTRLFGRDLNIKSRNRDANRDNNRGQNPEPRGLSSLVQGFHNNTPPGMLPSMPHQQVPNPMSLIDPIFLQNLAAVNPYGDMKFGEYDNSDQRNSYKDRHQRRRNDDRSYDRHDDRDRHRYDDRRGNERRTDKWKNNRR